MRYVEGSRVQFGSPACYRLSADTTFTKTVSAMLALGKRHVPMHEAKAAVERLVDGQVITVDVPMLEDAILFEGELRELGVRAMREMPAAAEG